MQTMERHKQELGREIEGILIKIGAQRLRSVVSKVRAGYIVKPDDDDDDVDEQEQGSKPRLMISYCWKQQVQIKRIHAELKKMGYEIWIDFIDMAEAAQGRSILEAMSAGIDQADVLLVCVSREYSASANCRL